MCTVKIVLCFSLIYILKGYILAEPIPINDLKTTPCAPTDSFTLDCNTCYCNGQGTGYLCTEKICPINLPILEESLPPSLSSTSRPKKTHGSRKSTTPSWSPPSPTPPSSAVSEAILAATDSEEPTTSE